MKLGVFTPVFAGLDTAGMLAKVKSFNGIEALELGTGGWPGSNHLDLVRLKEPCHLKEYRQVIADAGLSISTKSDPWLPPGRTFRIPGPPPRGAVAEPRVAGGGGG